MGRALQDELQTPETPEEAPQMALLPELQLPLDAQHQTIAVQTILSDFEAAKQARDGRDYGWGAKGEKRGFEEWL